MTIILLIVWGIGMMGLARWLCGYWLNHLSLYTATWTLSLGAYELQLIRYNSIGPGAWLYFFMAWIAIYVGTAVAMVLGNRLPKPPSADSLRRLRMVILLFSVAGFVSCIVLARQIMREVDPNLLVAMTVGAPKIYAAAFQETGEFVGLAYLGFLPYAASALAGAYAARKGRIDWVSILPLLVATVTGILSVSRFGMLLAVTLFLMSLYLTPKNVRFSVTRVQKTVLVLICIAGFGFVTLTRTDLSGSVQNQSATLNRISDWMPLAPSFYFYVSATPVGLSEYLRDSSREANLPWGRYTFASLYRFFSKLGLATYVPFHQQFYSVPEAINTGTYLREVHSDFGTVGVFFFPFLLGMVAQWLSAFRKNLVRIMFLAHLYVVVLFSVSNLVITR